MKAHLRSISTLFFTTGPKETTGFWSAIVILLITLSAFGSLSSCQRAPNAYLMPTHRQAAQRLPVTSSTVKTTPDSLLTASVNEEVPLPTKPIWEEPAAPAQELSTGTTESQSTVRPLKRLRSRRAMPPQCDQIVLRNGDVIEAKIKEVGVNEIKYKKCDRQDGPDYTISKRDVLSIKYSTGDVERFNSAANPSTSSGNRSSYDSPTNAQNDGPRTDPFAIVAIATGGLAILTGYGAFLLGAAAIVFGALSLTRIRKEPGRFKGKGLAIGGMVAGIVSAAVILLYILL